LPIFKENDFNWNITPSNHDAPAIIKARAKVLPLIAKNLIEFRFDGERREIQDFIKTSLYRNAPSVKIYITADNFVHVYNRWVKEVKPVLNISRDDWIAFKEEGVLDCDFYRADLMSKDGSTITDKLKIVLDHDKYKFRFILKGRLFYSDIDFTNGGKAYNQFWNKYQRPPIEEFQAHIIDRRDLLVPQNIREVKGSFFTPPQWVKKSQEYLAKTFGKSWQDEYYIWDCAAGTGNLLAGLTNEYNIWASTIDNPDVDSMKALINDAGDTGGRIFNLLEGHIFQFDFLNDKFDKLPRSLQDIINDPEKRKRLVVYINPPYAEAGNKATIVDQGTNKAKVAESRIFHKFENIAGTAVLELFAQFILRIYSEIPGCKLAMFSKLKHITSANFAKFRAYVKAGYKGGFVCCADTFDNVKGKFPIAFLIWDLAAEKEISEIKTDVMIAEVKRNVITSVSKEGIKTFIAEQKGRLSVDWLRGYFDKTGELIGYLRLHLNDIQNKAAVFITSLPSQSDFDKHEAANITAKNLIEVAIYCSIRQVIEATWLNDRDQFLYPEEGWAVDTEFQNDCLVNVLFNNVIQSAHGVNHWIPFTEKAVGARDKFQSNFMSKFLKDRDLSPEAAAVMEAGKALWKYYHKTIRSNRAASVDASFYDIRDFFQGRKDDGKMKTRSTDETYSILMSNLREAQKKLASHIAPKVYEYGFLKE